MRAKTSLERPTTRRSAAGRIGAAFLVVLLAACGGGGEGDDGDTGAQSPIITTQPVDVSAVQGTAVTLRVVATGSSPLQYQWSRSADGVAFAAIAGATNDTYSTGDTTLAQNGTRYRVAVSNDIGSAISTVVRLTVTAP